MTECSEDYGPGIAPYQLGRLLGYEQPHATIHRMYSVLKRMQQWDGEVVVDDHGRLRWLSIPAAIKIVFHSHSIKADEVLRWLKRRQIQQPNGSAPLYGGSNETNA